MENCKKQRFFPKPLLLDIFVRQNYSRIGPCESSRPEASENVVLFGRATFLTGVIAAQSQQRAEKVGVSSGLGSIWFFLIFSQGFESFLKLYINHRVLG